MIKRKRRKNPYDEQNLIDLFEKDGINIKVFGSGYEANIYYFELNKRKVLPIDGLLLNKGDYVLKIYYDSSELSKKEIDRLMLLSNYGVIPKIYFIKSNIIIMDYVNGKTYIEFRRENSFNEKRKIVDSKIEDFKRVWEKLGLRHGDLNHTNILITENLKVYFIDPHI